MAEALTALIAYHFLFFRRQYADPFRNSTGELVSTHFPHWTWMGRQISKGASWLKDDIYYYKPGAIPFLSSYYPWHILSAFIGAKLSLDGAFKFLHYGIISHYLIGGTLSFMMFSQWYGPEISLFGALTTTYMGASQRIQNPCIAYTLAWIPGIFCGGWLAIVSVSMAILGGYWPVLVYLFPVAAFMNPECLWGVIPALPQIIPFMTYWPKSIRHKQKVDSEFGSVPLWRFTQMCGIGYRGYIRGVLFFESVMAVGIAPFLAVFNQSLAWILAALSFVMSLGKLPVPFRVPARFIYPLSFFLIWMAVSGMQALGLSHKVTWLLIIAQAVLLLPNASLYPLWPFTEWQRKPSEWFTKETYDLKDFPYFTGYIHEVRTKGYTGGFSLKETCRRNGVEDPNGARV